ncbi:SAF domain-containing protein [Luteococcus sp. H138]|uniref:SAF domain-containing protein n=1 Tax=unclassified Luteococcus TaxID=2639923 RepID=UPI00313D6907
MLRTATSETAAAPPVDRDRPAALASHLRPRRSPRLVAAGLLLACLGGLGGAMAYQEASHANQVVVMQRSVPRGEVVHATDLAVVTIGPAPGVHTVDAEQLPSLVGKQALVDLAAGSLVGAGSVGEPKLPAGSAQLGLKLAAGRVPVETMPAGTPIQLVEVTSDKHESSALVVDASVVTAPRTLPDGSSQTLDVAVPEAQASRVADLSARDLLVVVRKAGG